MNELLAKFNRYQRSEQIALLLMGVALVAFILWLAVIMPLEKKRKQLETGTIAAVKTLGNVQTMVASIGRNGAARSGGAGENINGLIDSSIRAANLSMNSFQPGANGEVRIRLDRANYSSLMQWLYDIEYTHGVTIKDLSIAATNEVGFVNANLRLQKN